MCDYSIRRAAQLILILKRNNNYKVSDELKIKYPIVNDILKVKNILHVTFWHKIDTMFIN